MTTIVEVCGVVVLALVRFVATLDEKHISADKKTEKRDDPINRKISHDHQVIGAGHDEDRQVFVEVLYRDGMARAHQNVSAVL